MKYVLCRGIHQLMAFPCFCFIFFSFMCYSWILNNLGCIYESPSCVLAAFIFKNLLLVWTPGLFYSDVWTGNDESQ